MAENFEEQFLLMLSPYDRTDNGFYGNYKVDKSGKLIIDASGNLIPEDPKLVGTLKPVNPIKNADSWEKAVREDIKKISQTKVGSLLLRSIKYYGKVVTIHPRRVNDCNAGTSPEEGTDNKGNSVVSGATISFSPGIYQTGGTCAEKHRKMGGFHIESHETLLHELVHAFRMVSGKLKRIPSNKGLTFYSDNEDFIAVLVQGIYASERRTPVRASHFKHFEIDKELNGSLKFFKSSSEAFKYVEKFCLENPGFTKGFININTNFNPINAYYQDRDVARQFSRSAFARGRDVIMPIVETTINFLRKNL